MDTEKQFEKLEKLLTDLTGATAKGFADMSDRFTGLECRIDTLEARQTAVEQRLDSLEHRMTTLEARVNGIPERIEQTIDQLYGPMLNAHEGRIRTLEVA